MKEPADKLARRFDAQAGIAIKPILFIIVILVILIAAIVMGSGGFFSDTKGETNRNKALALMQIGETLKSGADRLSVENKTAFNAIDTSPEHTSGSNALFSPDGGGVTAPSYALASNPSNDGTAAHGDIWFYPHGSVLGLGSSDGNELLAVLSISKDVCTEINKKANGIATPPASDLGDFTSVEENTKITQAWPAALSGRTVGCVQNAAMKNKYFFFQVLVIQ